MCGESLMMRVMIIDDVYVMITCVIIFSKIEMRARKTLLIAIVNTRINKMELSEQTWIDASMTAAKHFPINDTFIDNDTLIDNDHQSVLKIVNYMTFTRERFDELKVQNHRASLGRTLDEIFPTNDRPRGQDDISSVEYHIKCDVITPIVLLKNNIKGCDNYVVLDGAHRIVAAYLTNRLIPAYICMYL
jgi:hypothetical protein